MENTSHDPQGIIAGQHALTHQPVTVLSGGGVLARGTVLGQISVGAKTASAAAGVPAPAAATFTGTIAADATAVTGAHRFECIVGGSGAASKWRHTDPTGKFVGIATTGSAYTGGGLSGGTINDAGTDPTPGEAFTVTVAEAGASNKWAKSVAAATDGSQTPEAILAVDVDATEADVTAPAYLEGEFASEMLTYGAGHTATTVEAAFRTSGQAIYLKSVGAVA